MSKNFSIYLPQPASPSPWGIEIVGTGFAEVEPHSRYPQPKHPEDHLFDWEQGRILNEYQVLLISEGKGLIETARTLPETIQGPSLFIIFPGIWHRYRPDFATGWREYWVAFNGDYPEKLQAQDTISPDMPIHHVGHNDAILSQFQLLQSEIREEALGFRRISASAIIQILALSTTLAHRREEELNPMRSVIRQASFLMRERVNLNISPEDIATELKIGYTYFRRLFKKYTGLSPKRYHSQLRLQKAQSMLLNTQLSVSSIADNLSFDSPFHFSNWFKNQTGQSPSHWKTSRNPRDAK
ncbi:MAG: AraC family transcriptional regulator [Verrucomicrobiota bacterium]